VSQDELISSIVREVLAELSGAAKPSASAAPAAGGLDPVKDFPLSEKRPDLVKTSTGKSLSDITLDAALKGTITAEELRITPEV